MRRISSCVPSGRSPCCASVLRHLLASEDRGCLNFSTLAQQASVSATALSDPTYLLPFFERLAKKLSIAEPVDWYNVPKKLLEEKGGGEIFRNYETLCQALRTAYPDYPWQANRFLSTRTPNGYWNDTKNLLRALDSAEKHLGIKAVEDWYSVNLSDLREVGFPAHFSKMQLVQLLTTKYPDYKWEKVYLLRGKYAQQKRLEKALQNLFPDVEMVVNARKAAGVINPNTGDAMELDIYMPSLNLGFEYQELHHYTSTDYAYEPVSTFAERDALKKTLVAAKGITLIVVPFWWDGKQESLVATIKSVRPELLKNVQVSAAPIPESMPEHSLDKYKKAHIEDIGEPTNACFLTRADTDPTNWWMFEKFDGLRGFWNPVKKAFYSRNGNKFSFPQDVIDTMPNMFLDGEIWFGRDNFSEASKIAARADPSRVDWHRFKYMVYDVPNMQGKYEERYKHLVEQLGKTKWPYLEVAQKEVCTGMEHLESFFQDIIDRGGEGVILRDPTTPLEPGRSRGYLKHKKYRDAEAKIIETLGPGQWKCILPNGVTFTAVPGTSEFIKRCTPKPGDVVTFKHRGFMVGSKKPKSPVLYRLRPDLPWEDVEKNWDEKMPRMSALPLKRPVKTRKPKGHWAIDENRRAFFAQYAQDTGFDPTVVANWDTVTSSAVRAKKGGKSILGSYNNSLIKALRSSFPEMAWQKEVMPKKPKHFWMVAQNCRRFFDAFARDAGFDPLDAPNWYGIDFHRLLTNKGAWTLRDQNGGFKLALKNAYPEIEFDSTWLGVDVLEKHHWKDSEKCRLFFDGLAQAKGKNPLELDTWRSIDPKEIQACKEGSLIKYQNGTLGIALKNAYPELKLDGIWEDQGNGAERTPKEYWQDIKNARSFFDEFATEVGINPLRVEDWYTIELQQLLTKKGGRAIRTIYGGLKNSLLAAYPELVFEDGWKRAERMSKDYWINPTNCRAHFDRYAAKQGFDPLDANAWDSITTQEMLTTSGVRSIHDAHGGLRNALRLAYPEVTFEDSLQGDKALRDQWKDPQACRKFFDDFAKEEGFDSLNPTSWYSINLHSMLLRKGGRAIRDSYAGFKRALKLAYPELEFADRWPRL